MVASRHSKGGIMTKLSFLTVLFLAAAAHASDPGQPPDCSDWVFAEPRYTCHDYNPYPATTGFLRGGTIPVQDNEGHLYAFRFHHSIVGSCGPYDLWRHVVVKIDGPSETSLAWIDDKCVDDATGETYYLMFPSKDYLDPGRLVFLPKDGRMLVPMAVGCNRQTSACPANPTGDQLYWVVRIDGFTTLSESFKPMRPRGR